MIMRRFYMLLWLFASYPVTAQVCLDQLNSVPLSNWSTSLDAAYLDGDAYLDAVNEAQYDGIWTIGTGVSNSNLAVFENPSISAFIGVKRRNVVAPNDNIAMAGNVYTIEPGYSPESQGSSEESTLAKWNFLLYANMGSYTFSDVDIRLYIDTDPCYLAQPSDMIEIEVASQFESFFGNSDFAAFGLNQNLASNFISAFDTDAPPFDPTQEGFYTLAVGVYDVCGNLKAWHEVIVNVTNATDLDSDGNGIADSQETPGCDNLLACNYSCESTYNDGSCDFNSCYGCTVLEACNYDASATTSDNSGCIYPIDLHGENHFDCDGNCVNDEDQDGICDEEEVDGCTDETACNFNANATDDNGTCVSPETGYNCEGNCLEDSDADGTCDIFEVPGCQDSDACNFDNTATEDDGTCEYLTCSGCTVEEACSFDANATISDFSACQFPTGCDTCSGETDGTGFVVDNDADNDGVCDADEIEGCTDNGACNYDANATDDVGCEYTSCVGCINPVACNYDDTALISGPCDFPAAFSNCFGCLLDVNSNDICDQLEISGCTDEDAINYNPQASIDNGSCSYMVGGCMLSWAPHYDPAANFQEMPVLDVCFGTPAPAGSPTPGEMPTGCEDQSACNYIPGGDTTLPCDYSCFGCTNEAACDYSEDAVYNTGCSDFESCYGCTDSLACNYDDGNTFEDGSCEYEACAGCTDPEACNYDSNKTVNIPMLCEFPTGCDTCSGETDGTGTILDGDSDNDGICDVDEVSGCDAPLACNYDAAVTENDGSCDFTSCIGCLESAACNYQGDDPTITLNEPIQCIYPEEGLDCDGECLADADQDGICDDDEIGGCQDESACNYNPAATDSDGTCAYPATYQDCNGECLVDEDNDGVCDQEEVFGCTTVLSCNYDPAATENDGSCEFASCTDCIDPTACNYNPEALLSDNLLCLYETNPELVFDAVLELSDNIVDWPSNNYLTSSDGAEEVSFVDYTSRLNDGRYSVTRIYTATSLCGTVEAAGQLLIGAEDQPAGCTHSDATNYDPTAVNDDGSCDFLPACLGDLNADAIIGATDLLIMLSLFGLPCN